MLNWNYAYEEQKDRESGGCGNRNRHIVRHCAYDWRRTAQFGNRNNA